MKIETFVKGIVVVLAVFTCGLILVGDSILQQEYGVSSAPTIEGIQQLDEEVHTMQGKMENESLVRSTRTGQTSLDQDTDETFWAYPSKALRTVSYTFSVSAKSKTAISGLLHYHKVNPLIKG